MIRLESLTLAGAIEVDARAGLDALSTGDRVRARVVSVGADSRPLLMLAGTTVSATLPFAVVPGQSLDLQVLATSPGLRFGLVPPGAVAANDGAAGAGVSQASISGTGRLLGGLLDALPSAGMPALALAADALDAPEALLRDPPRLARALARTLGESGLFYENHQAQWVEGGRDLESIRVEPQARNPVQLPPPPARDGNDSSPAAVPLHLTLLRQQLEVLGEQALAVRLQATPDLAFEWRTRVDEDAPGDAMDEPATWHSVIEGEFASLRRLQGRLTLRGNRLDIAIRGESAAIERMQAAVAQLSEALGAAGLQLGALHFGAAEPVDG